MAGVRHYETKPRSCIEVIEGALSPEEFKGFCKGNVIKYLYREGDKRDAEKDVYKALDYACMLSQGVFLEEFVRDQLNNGSFE